MKYYLKYASIKKNLSCNIGFGAGGIKIGNLSRLESYGCDVKIYSLSLKDILKLKHDAKNYKYMSGLYFGISVDE